MATRPWDFVKITRGQTVGNDGVVWGFVKVRGTHGSLPPTTVRVKLQHKTLEVVQPEEDMKVHINPEPDEFDFWEQPADSGNGMWVGMPLGGKSSKSVQHKLKRKLSPIEEDAKEVDPAMWDGPWGVLADCGAQSLDSESCRKERKKSSIQTMVQNGSAISTQRIARLKHSNDYMFGCKHGAALHLVGKFLTKHGNTPSSRTMGPRPTNPVPLPRTNQITTRRIEEFISKPSNKKAKKVESLIFSGSVGKRSRTYETSEDDRAGGRRGQDTG